MWKPLVILMLTISFMACQKAAPRSAGPLRQIRVAYTTQPQSTLVHVALAKGYFAEEGLEVQASLHTFGKASLQSLLDHKADFATVAETPFMFNVLKGEKIFIVANIEASTTNNAIVARRDRGVSGPKDLKGKRIGFTPGTTSDFFLDSLLTAIGMTRREIRPVPLKPEEMQEAILSGKVDAVCTWNYPLAQTKHQLGANGLIIFDREIYTETYNVAAQQAFVRDHPETVERFLRALFKAERFVASHTDEAQAIQAAATSTDQATVREVWSVFSYRLGLDQTLLITLEDETRWAMKNKLTDQTVMPDYRKYIHIESLKAIKPEAVRLSQ